MTLPRFDPWAVLAAPNAAIRPASEISRLAGLAAAHPEGAELVEPGCNADPPLPEPGTLERLAVDRKQAAMVAGHLAGYRRYC